MARRKDPTKAAAEIEKIAQKASQDYVEAKGFSDSSLEAVRRAAKANKRKARIRMGGYSQDI